MSCRRMLSVLAAVALVATACFKVELDVAIEDDGSGRIEGLTAVNAKTVAEFGALFDEGDALDIPEADQVCEEFLADNEAPAGATIEPYEDGDFCGITYSVDFSATEMDAALDEMAGGDGDFVIRRDGDGWLFEATSDESAATGTDFFPEELFTDAEFTVRVKLPGRQVEHNADFIDSDGAMVWELDLLDPAPSLMARTEPGQPITGSGGGGAATPR